ncbi:Hypothetical predicted protein [Marmota monax]|uniref:Uncharacterized protein n=1 Tax=Marmota monax TaxID=9995 RepID=A0A5E4A3W4_MARMO|nr:Hypothetical predicted protein [Marmota monax]
MLSWACGVTWWPVLEPTRREGVTQRPSQTCPPPGSLPCLSCLGLVNSALLSAPEIESRLEAESWPTGLQTPAWAQGAPALGHAFLLPALMETPASGSEVGCRPSAILFGLDQVATISDPRELTPREPHSVCVPGRTHMWEPVVWWGPG